MFDLVAAKASGSLLQVAQQVERSGGMYSGMHDANGKYNNHSMPSHTGMLGNHIPFPASPEQIHSPSTSEQLAAAAAASLAEEFTRYNPSANEPTQQQSNLPPNGIGSYDSSVDYSQMLAMGGYYHSYDGSMSHEAQQAMFVDPTQIGGSLDANGEMSSGTYGPSPSSDEWPTPSSTASPEPFAGQSSSSAPTSNPLRGDGSTGGLRASGRKIVSMKRAQEAPRKFAAAPGSSALRPSLSHKKKSGISQAMSMSLSGSSSKGGNPGSSGSGDNGDAGGHLSSAPLGEDADGVPTVCTNCATTTTPLWRRNPEGQPLCEPFWIKFFAVLQSNDLCSR